MKHSATKAPKGTTHARLIAADGKKAVVPLKHITTLDGVEGTLTFLKETKPGQFEELTPAPAPAPLHPHGAPTTVVMAFKNQKDGAIATARVIGDNAKELGRALKAVAQKFGGGTWGRDTSANVENYKGEVDVDLTLPAKAKAKPAPAVQAANGKPLKDRASAAPKAAKETPAPAPAKVTKADDDEGKHGHKGVFIEGLLTGAQPLKLSTILDRTMSAYPAGNPGRTLRRIRKTVVNMKKGKAKLTFIDEPEYSAGK